MSPRKLRKSHLMDQSVTTRSRIKAYSVTSKNTKDFLYNEEDLNNREKDKTNNSIINDSQLKDEKTWKTRSSKKKMYSEKSKKHYSSNRNTSAKNLEVKLNKDVVHNNSLIDMDNISRELLEESPVQLRCTDKMKRFKKSPEQSFININTKEENIHNKSFNGTITPKSSPISVPLTPLRTTKTPKRSPLNIASPKTHSEVPFRLLKTPKKLNLSINSAIKLTNSDMPLQNKKNANNDIENITLDNNSMNHVSTKSKKLKKSHISTEELKFTPRRLSKVPKCILKSPKLKSECGRKKLVIRKGFSTPKLKSPNKKKSTKVITFPNKSITDYKSLSSGESDLELTLTNVNNLSEQYKEIILKKPIVKLERIPFLDSLGESLKTQGNQCLTVDTSNVEKYVQKQLFKNLSSLKHSISSIKKKNMLSKNFNNKKNKKLDNTNFVVSSTPKIKFKTDLNDSILLHSSIKATSSPINDKRKHHSSPFTPVSCADEEIKNILVKDDVQNLTYDKNETNDNQNNTVTVENEKTVLADETYDLFEPTTPHLQKQRRKRTILEVDTDDKKEIKKARKIRFTSPSYKQHNINKLQTNDKITIRKTPVVKYVSPKRSSSVSNTSTRKSISNFEFRRRSNSTSNIGTTPRKNSKDMENTPSRAPNKTKSNTENQEEKGTRTQSAKKKIPNFAKIHKQMFEKMESVVDNKKRLMQQHEALKTPKGSRVDKSNTKKLISPETRSRKYNRFGFKLNKVVATNIILRKPQKNVQKEKREEVKTFLKGVRTNRRFELQMKMRKISG